MQTPHKRGMSLLVRGGRQLAAEEAEQQREHLRNTKHQPPHQVRTQVREKKVRELSRI